MIRFRRLLPIAAILAGIAVMGTPNQAYAKFQLRITTSSGFSSTITDDLAGDGLIATAGAINFTGSAGKNFTVTVATSLSKPSAGTALNPQMDLSFVVNNTTGKADKIWIEASDTDFGPLLASGNFVSTIGGTLKTKATVTYQTHQDTGNTEFGSTSSSNLLTFTTTPYSGVASLPVSPASNYSLTQSVTVDYVAGLKGATSGDATLATPAPAGLLLGLIGAPVLGIGAYLRRRRLSAAL